ncbi:McrC family protein [Sansalvadorimonas sp. 2012CJ34-2]|uniref:McrC family protein n=1 Tax=Parendozoicomonas callyspongiae TaxID=2942213 RepID=A0ABT0PN38_9GAMM|nr:McrC family protein [Sansalvadorimonas sp. 2012CJ34-2]MCL6272152.1 McrC family protein [Sansalvadorimonas sp. 2012CJ34-2]
MAVSVITVFEYGYLSCEAEDSRCSRVSAQAFDYLEILCLSQSEETPAFLRLCSWGGFKALQVRNYVGVIHTPMDVQIEVLPKTSAADNESEQEARASLLNMLRHLHAFRNIETTDALVATQKMSLLEVFVSQFLQSVNLLVKRGLRSEYIRREDNQTFMKGKLLPSQQLKHNLVNQHRFYVEYDEYLQNRPVNRLLHSALIKVANYAHSNRNQKLCRELSFAFNNVPPSRNIKKDFAAMKLGRGMDYYKSPLAWARLILEGFSPLSMHGKETTVSLLFPMEAVFESYVASILRRQLKPPFSLKEQASSKYLVDYGSNHWFRLKPDLLIMKGKQVVQVLDTKWKLLDSEKDNGKDKLGLSQSDFYQMFAYGHKYCGGQGEMMLIYPRTEQFREAIQQSFDFSKSLKLWVVPFDIGGRTLESERLRLPSLYSGPLRAQPEIANEI